MVTAVYASIHFLVDLICAWAMFAFFRAGSYENLLVYNFCAFALQMPFGALMDLLRTRRREAGLGCSCAGVCLTLLGAMIHPAVLGIGNALFHVGGGLDVIDSDFAHSKRGAYLGIFVAPGAVGLYLGTLLGKNGFGRLLVVPTGLMMLGLLFLLHWRKPASEQMVPEATEGRRNGIPILVLGCFMVVILRSWVGLGVQFSWKGVAPYGFLAVISAALGKALGGILAARWGNRRTVCGTLAAAALCYLFAELPVWGLFAVCLFNMSMPVTLYLLAENLPGLPGFSFGLLTFGLFLGFLPVYGGVLVPLQPGIFGMTGSLISLVLLWAAGKAVEHGKLPV